MSVKRLWLLALGLTVLLGLGYFYTQKWQHQSPLLGINQKAFLVSSPGAPVLHWGELSAFSDGGLKLMPGSLSNAQSLLDLEGEARLVWPSLKAQQVQPGAWLLDLAGHRVWLLAAPFTPEDLDPTLPADYRSDWTVLERSSLLPESWPEPTRGWVVLSRGTLSNRLKQLVIDTRKPVVVPEPGGTVWLEWREGEWLVSVPES